MRSPLCWAVGLGAILLLACGDAPEPGPAAGRDRGQAASPSVLLITVDTTRADRLEPYGAASARTPALASLADTGVVFDQAVAVTPITAPSHASLFTGLYPPRHGVHDNGTHRLPATIPTAAEIFRDAGYRTAGFVSAAVLERRYGLDRGFETYDDDLAGSGSRREVRMMLERQASVSVDRALAWVDGLERGERFFLWVHLFDPHAPYLPPDPWAREFADSPYDGEIAYMDSQIGRLLRHPRLSEDEAVVAVVGDHGESRGEHGEETHGLLVYQSTLRIPWILRLPDGPAGQRIETPVSQVDLLPTLVEWLGLAPGSVELDGRSLIPVLAGEPLERTLYSESEVPRNSYGWAALHSVRDGELKYIAAPQEELYDLGSDPDESRNIAATEEAEVRRLAQELERYLQRPAGRSERVETDEVTRARLEALGYTVGEEGGPRGAEGGDPKLLIGVHEELQTTAALLAVGRAEEAVRRLRELQESDPGNTGILRQLVRGLVLSDRLDEAAVVAAEAQAGASGNPRARLVQADVEYRRNDLEAALALVEEALRLDPSLFEARLAKARYLARMGRLDEAATEFSALRSEVGSRPLLDLRQAEVLDLPEGRLEVAEGRLREALAVDPFLAEGWALLADLLARQGKGDEAMSVYREGLELNPGDRILELRLALALAASGDPTGEAERIWEAHVKRYPRSAQAWINLSSLALQNREWAEAERLAREAAERDSELPTVWNAIGIAAEQQGRTADAAVAYRRAVRVDPEYWQARLNLGLLSYREGRYSEAETELQAVVQRVPGHPGAHFGLGMMFAGPVDDRVRARHHLEASIRLDPDSPRAAEARRALESLGTTDDLPR